MFCSRPISIFLHQIACGFLAFFCVRGGQLEAEASLTDLKGQTAVSIIVNQPTLRGRFPGVFGEPVLRAVL